MVQFVSTHRVGLVVASVFVLAGAWLTTSLTGVSTLLALLYSGFAVLVIWQALGDIVMSSVPGDYCDCDDEDDCPHGRPPRTAEIRHQFQTLELRAERTTTPAKGIRFSLTAALAESAHVTAVQWEIDRFWAERPEDSHRWVTWTNGRTLVGEEWRRMRSQHLEFFLSLADDTFRDLGRPWHQFRAVARVGFLEGMPAEVTARIK